MKKYFINRVLALVILSAYLSAPSIGFASVGISSLELPRSLATHIEYIEDLEHVFTIDEIDSRKVSELWRKNTSSDFLGKSITAKYWFKIEVQWLGEKDSTGVMYVKNNPGLLAHLGFFYQNDYLEGRKIFKTGFLEKFSSRDISANQYGFRVPLRAGHTNTFYGWIDNSAGGIPSLMPLTLSSPDHFYAAEYRIQILLTAFYSIMGALCLYNLCLFLSLKERSYGLYIIFLCSAAMVCACNDGTAIRWLWPNNPEVTQKVLVFNGILIPIAYLSFVIATLDCIQYKEKVTVAYQATLFVGLVALIHNFISPDFTTSVIFTQFYAVIGMLVSLVVILFSIRSRQTIAIYIFAAEMMTLAGAVTYIMMYQGLLPFSDVASWGLHWGFAGEALFLSFALASRTRQAQLSAIASMADYEALYQDSMEGRFFYSLQDDTGRCNKALAKLWGCQSADSFMTKQKFRNLSDPAVNKKMMDILLEKGLVTDYEFQLPSVAVKENTWVSVNMRLNKDEKGRPDIIEGSVIDISERKLRVAADQERQIAKENNKAKSQFFASISHELRTPLTSILGYSELAQAKDLSSEERIRHLRTIERGGKHLLSLINDVLDLSKVEAQKLDVEKIDVSIPKVLYEIEEIFKLKAQEKNINFLLECDSPIPRNITTDPTRLKQILINICGNAVKFTERGSVTISVSYSTSSQLIQFVVKDSGIGLGANQIENLFDAFTQADHSTARNYGGTGLGLHLTKQLTELLGGQIKVESQLDLGSIFTVSVATGDLTEVEWLDELTSYQVIDNAPIAVPTFHGRVLYVEDKPQTQELIQCWVEETGADISLASNGAQALTLTKNQSFDLILTDIHMPQMDGIELLDRLRKSGVSSPVIALTASAETVRSIADMPAFDGVYHKPMSKSAFFNALAPYLSLSEPVLEADHLPRKIKERIRVLLAEDNIENQKLLSLHLKRSGAEVECVIDGGEAISKAINEPFDLILMDMQMPSMDGMSAVRYLRSKGYDGKINALTANSSSDAIVECQAAGCDGYLSKPLDSRRLSAVINALR